MSTDCTLGTGVQTATHKQWSGLSFVGLYFTEREKNGHDLWELMTSAKPKKRKRLYFTQAISAQAPLRKF